MRSANVFIALGLTSLVLTGCASRSARSNPTPSAQANSDQKQLKLDTFHPPSPTPSPSPAATPQSFICQNATVTSREPNIIWAVSPNPGSSVGPGGKLKLWYNDELPLTLGEGLVSQMQQVPDHVSNPNIGDAAARDTQGLPYFPAVFITDVTSDPNNTAGDAEHGGTPHKPDDVYGAWYALGSMSIGIPHNGLNLPPGADPFPATSNVGATTIRREMEYSAELIWNVDNFGLAPGHKYRAQFVIHDGDYVGDVAIGCMAIQY